MLTCAWYRPTLFAGKSQPDVVLSPWARKRERRDSEDRKIKKRKEESLVKFGWTWRGEEPLFHMIRVRDYDQALLNNNLSLHVSVYV